MAKTKRAIKEIIKKYKVKLKELGVQADRIILFGSFAKGTAQEHSDIDLILISDDFKKNNLRERIEVLGIASARIMEPIEARGYTHKEIQNVSPLNFISEVIKTGLVIS